MPSRYWDEAAIFVAYGADAIVAPRLPLGRGERSYLADPVLLLS